MLKVEQYDYIRNPKEREILKDIQTESVWVSENLTPLLFTK